MMRMADACERDDVDDDDDCDDNGDVVIMMMMRLRVMMIVLIWMISGCSYPANSSLPAMSFCMSIIISWVYSLGSCPVGLI